MSGARKKLSEEEIKTLEEMEDIMVRLNERFSINLQLNWKPGYIKYSHGKRISGEVVGDTVYVYTEGGEAVETIKHEYLDYMISTKIEKPYLDWINKLHELMGRNIYEEKEKLVDQLISLI